MMNPFVTSFCLGTISAVLLSAPIQAIASVPSFAQVKQVHEIDTPTLLAQMTSLPVFADVNITPQQEAMLRPIFEQTRARLDRILSVEQQNSFHQAIVDGRSLEQAVAAMELSPEQEAQLDGVLQMTGLQVAPILTPQQREQLEANLQAARS